MAKKPDLGASFFTDLLDGDPEVERAKKEAASTVEERDQFLADLKETFTPPHGRRVLLAMVKSLYTFQSVFTGNSATYYRSGIQDWGRKLMDAIAAADRETYLWLATQRANEIYNRFSGKLTAEKLKQAEDERRP